MTAATPHHVQDGDPAAPALLLLGPLGATTQLWRPVTAALADRFRVIRVDHRGHGWSTGEPGPYDVADVAADLVLLLDGLDVPRAHLAGLGLGALGALRLAATWPDRVDRLALLAPGEPEPPGGWYAGAAAVRSGGTGAVAAEVARAWCAPADPAADPTREAWVRRMLETVTPDGYAAGCAAMAAADPAGDVAAVRAPVLVLTGTDDPATPPERAAELAARLAGAVLRTLPGAGHLLPLDASDDVARLLLEHLTGGPPPPP